MQKSADVPIIAVHEVPDQSTWAQICAVSPDATPFHTPSWSRALVSATPGLRAAPSLFHFTDGSTSLVPMHEGGPRGRLCQRVSVEPGVYGGPIGQHPMSEGHIASIAHHYARSSPGGCAFVGNPFSNWQIPDGSGYSSTPLQTHVLCLEGGAGDAWAKMSSGHRRNIRHARRSGVESSLAASAQDVSDYYSAYRDSLRRWGAAARSFYPERLFHSLLAEGETFARLWLARVRGQVVGGALILSWGPLAVYWHGATLESALPLRPGHAVLMAAIEDAASRGCRRFDFSPSGDLEGVIRFKEGFGGRPILSRTWFIPPRPAARLLQRASRRLSGPS